MADVGLHRTLDGQQRLIESRPGASVQVKEDGRVGWRHGTDRRLAASNHTVVVRPPDDVADHL